MPTRTARTMGAPRPLWHSTLLPARTPTSCRHPSRPPNTPKVRYMANSTHAKAHRATTRFIATDTTQCIVRVEYTLGTSHRNTLPHNTTLHNPKHGTYTEHIWQPSIHQPFGYQALSKLHPLPKLTLLSCTPSGGLWCRFYKDPINTRSRAHTCAKTAYDNESDMFNAFILRRQPMWTTTYASVY